MLCSLHSQLGTLVLASCWPHKACPESQKDQHSVQESGSQKVSGPFNPIIAQKKTNYVLEMALGFSPGGRVFLQPPPMVTSKAAGLGPALSTWCESGPAGSPGASPSPGSGSRPRGPHHGQRAISHPPPRSGPCGQLQRVPGFCPLLSMAVLQEDPKHSDKDTAQPGYWVSPASRVNVPKKLKE